MDRRPKRVEQAQPDPDRVATMYGELGNKLVSVEWFLRCVQFEYLVSKRAIRLIIRTNRFNMRNARNPSLIYRHTRLKLFEL